MHARANPVGAALSRESDVTDVSRGGVRRYGKDCGSDHTACEGRTRHAQRSRRVGVVACLPESDGAVTRVISWSSCLSGPRHTSPPDFPEENVHEERRVPPWRHPRTPWPGCAWHIAAWRAANVGSRAW